MTALTRSRSVHAARPARGGLLNALLSLDASWRSRRALGRLTAEQLADAGLTVADGRAHSDLPTWDVPSTWLR